MHTPGPWHVSRRGDFDCDVAGPNGEDLAFVNCSDGLDEPTHYPMEANACLIAAAPDLLAILRRIRDSYPGYIPDFIEAVNAAIDKATGVPVSSAMRAEK